MKSLHSLRTRGCRIPVIPTLAMLALALPKLSMAQAVATTVAPTVTQADLVGSWALQGSKELGFTFRADSTMSAVGQRPEGKMTLTGQWLLAGDVLIVTDVSAMINGSPASVDVTRRTISLQKNQLILTKVDNQEVEVYERVDSLITPRSKSSPRSKNSPRSKSSAASKP